FATPIPREGKDQSLRLNDFAVDTARMVLSALRRTHPAPPFAADPHIHFVGDRSEALRPPPSRGLLLVDPGGKDQRPRCIQHSLEDQFAVVAHGDLSFCCSSCR